MDEAWMIMDGGLIDRGGRVFAEKFKLVVCGFELEGRGGIWGRHRGRGGGKRQ